MNKRFSSSPLPFRGSKRYYIKRFREVLAQADDIDTVVDLFGGSGLLSRWQKICYQIAALFITTSTITTKGWQMWPIQTRCCVLLRHWLQLYQTTRKSPQKQKKQYWSYALRQRRNTRSITSRFQAHFCFRETGRKVMSS